MSEIRPEAREASGALDALSPAKQMPFVIAKTDLIAFALCFAAAFLDARRFLSPEIWGREWLAAGFLGLYAGAVETAFREKKTLPGVLVAAGLRRRGGAEPAAGVLPGMGAVPPGAVPARLCPAVADQPLLPPPAAGRRAAEHAVRGGGAFQAGAVHRLLWLYAPAAAVHLAGLRAAVRMRLRHDRSADRQADVPGLDAFLRRHPGRAVPVLTGDGHGISIR